MGFREYFVSLTLVGVFIFAFINFGVNFGNDNNATVSILENEQINSTFQALETNLSAFEPTAQEQRENYEDVLPDQTFIGTLISFPIISGARAFVSLAIGIFNIALLPLVTILGVSAAILAVAGAIMLFRSILESWGLVKTGR